MLNNNRRASSFIKAFVGAQDIPNIRELRPRCVLCGKARSGRHRENGPLAKICSRPGCDSFLKSKFPNEESLEKLIVLEVHHYFHGEAGSNVDLAQPTPVELSGDNTAEKRVEMPDNKSRRVTRAMTRRRKANDHECPPLYRRFNKPTLIL
jgi:hypothetical protein